MIDEKTVHVPVIPATVLETPGGAGEHTGTRTGKKTPGGAGTHTGHTGHADAQRHTDHTDEPHGVVCVSVTVHRPRASQRPTCAGSDPGLTVFVSAVRVSPREHEDEASVNTSEV